MKLNQAIGIALIIFALGGTFYLFIRPVLVKSPQIVTDRNLDYAGRSPDGESAYTVAKAEITYWVEMVCKIAPTVALLGALWLKDKRRKKEVSECGKKKKDENGSV